MLKNALISFKKFNLESTRFHGKRVFLILFCLLTSLYYHDLCLSPESFKKRQRSQFFDDNCTQLVTVLLPFRNARGEQKCYQVQ
jgi:hypothetical protein